MKKWIAAVPVTALLLMPTAAIAKSCSLGPNAHCQGANLKGKNLKGKNLKGANFKNANLKNANLKGANLKGANLKNTNLKNANLKNANLKNANALKANMFNINGQSTSFLNTNLQKVNLQKSNLSGATLKSANASNSNLGNANAQGTSFQGTNLGSANLQGAKFNNNVWQGVKLSGAKTNDDAGATLHVLPQDGPKIVQAIDSAQKTVDIVIYELGGPNIVGQAGAPGALMRAVSRGVNVRIIVNGQWWNKYCKESTPQGKCASNSKLDWLYATQDSLNAAASGVANPGKVTLNFANNNFQVTHQKTILIDSSDPTTGLPLAANQLPTTARALVSTGNLESYGWASKSLTNPIEGCTQNNCTEWAARDFYVDVTRADLVTTIENVFFSDLHCGAVPPDTTPSTTNTNGLLTTPLPLTWSNGSTWTQPGGTNGYPSAADGYDGAPATAVNQGNARQRTLDLINGANKSLLVYNEELGDAQILNAIVAQSKKLGPGNVKVVMTMSSSWFSAWTQLYKAGAEIRLTQVDDSPDYSKQLYVHAKVIIADQTNVFMGSENISTPSLNANRELGVMMTTRGGASGEWLLNLMGVTTLINTFYNDFNTPNYLDWELTPNQSNDVKSNVNENFPMLCGPIPARA